MPTFRCPVITTLAYNIEERCVYEESKGNRNLKLFICSH
jgi:hypothetical protein